MRARPGEHAPAGGVRRRPHAYTRAGRREPATKRPYAARHGQRPHQAGQVAIGLPVRRAARVQGVDGDDGIGVLLGASAFGQVTATPAPLANPPAAPGVKTNVTQLFSPSMTALRPLWRKAPCQHDRHPSAGKATTSPEQFALQGLELASWSFSLPCAEECPLFPVEPKQPEGKTARFGSLAVNRFRLSPATSFLGKAWGNSAG